jgi:DNA topoisomerase-1
MKEYLDASLVKTITQGGQEKPNPIYVDKNSPWYRKNLAFKYANLKAAELCNHMTSLSQSEKRQERAKRMENLRKAAIAEETGRNGPGNQWVKYRIESLAEKKSSDNKTVIGVVNLPTSITNYIDPRIVKDWASKIGEDWQKFYPQKQAQEFSWVDRDPKYAEVVARYKD